MSLASPGSESRGTRLRRRFSYVVVSCIGVLLLVVGGVFPTVPGLVGGAVVGGTAYWFEYQFWDYSPGLARHVFQVAVGLGVAAVFWLAVLFVTPWTTAADLATGFFGLVAGHWFALYTC